MKSLELKKKPLLFKQKLTEINQSKHTAIEINTVGSKDENKVAAAAVINHDVFSARLPNEATIFTAEANAIQLALEHAWKKFYICKDFTIVIEGLQNLSLCIAFTVFEQRGMYMYIATYLLPQITRSHSLDTFLTSQGYREAIVTRIPTGFTILKQTNILTMVSRSQIAAEIADTLERARQSGQPYVQDFARHPRVSSAIVLFVRHP